MKSIRITLFIVSFIFLFTSSKSPNFWVYICDSPNAYAYHIGYCQGLSKCTHQVIQVSKTDACYKYGKCKACGYCY